MINNFYQPSASDIVQITWHGDPVEYDRSLFELGAGYAQFLIINPCITDTDIIHYIKEFPVTDKCVVWNYNNKWIAKLFSSNWKYREQYHEIEIVKPQVIWKKNPELDKLIQFEYNPVGEFEPGPWDVEYQHVWYIDPKFNPLSDKVWAISCQTVGNKITGTKDMGYISPRVHVEFNDHLPDLNVNIDQCYPPFWDLAHECAYELDPVHQTNGDRLWVVKISPAYRKPKEWKWIGVVSPQFNITYNNELPDLNYELDYVIPWHDLAYEHVWFLDKKHLKNSEDDIWAIKITLTRDIVGSKIIDYISPTITTNYNNELPDINYELDYVIPWHDLAYEHVWFLDKKHLQSNNEDIWAIKLSAVNDPVGQKEIGKVVPIIPDNLDVIFISYHEPNAEKNWQRVLEKAPWAKRVDGVTGIFEAHKAAARLATTDMFYVVDGDAWIIDDWEFDYQPMLFDRKYTYIWSSINPVNNLCYGHGGIKLFPRKALLKIKKWNTLDLSTTVVPDLKIMNTVSNITAFNTDEYSTWRSAFREVVKLCDTIKKFPDNKDAKDRLESWKTLSGDPPFGKYALAAVDSAVEFFNENCNTVQLLQINNGQWLQTMFKNERPSVFNYIPIEKKVNNPNSYKKLKHSNPDHAEWFVVNWCLGNTCNFSCSYCPKDLHDASIAWPDLDVIKNFILRIKQAHVDKKLYFEFTGGEVTLYKHFIDVCQFCTEHNIKVGLISNGSRTLRYWEENKKYFDHVCLSFHPEEADEAHFVNVVKILNNDVRTHVNIMMSPERFDFCYAVANKVKNLGNISMALQPLIHDFGDKLFDYNEFQKKIFDKQHELIVKHIKYTKTFDYYRGAMVKIFPDGTRQVSSAQRFVSDKTNNWNGWKCYAGVEQLIVDKDGSIHRGWCKEGGPIGHIADPELNLVIEPVICGSTMCHCNFDIMCTKKQ